MYRKLLKRVHEVLLRFGSALYSLATEGVPYSTLFTVKNHGVIQNYVCVPHCYWIDYYCIDCSCVKSTCCLCVAVILPISLVLAVAIPWFLCGLAE